MRKSFYVSVLAIGLAILISSCNGFTDVNSHEEYLDKVEEMFNGHVAQTILPQGGDFYENGVKYLLGTIVFSGDDSMTDRGTWKEFPIGNNKANCDRLEFKKGDQPSTIWLCYLTGDNTKMSDCEQDDVFMGVPIYKDKQGYYYRFSDGGTAIQLSCTKDSKGNWIFWDSLKAYYSFKRFTKQ